MVISFEPTQHNYLKAELTDANTFAIYLSIFRQSNLGIIRNQ